MPQVNQTKVQATNPLDLPGKNKMDEPSNLIKSIVSTEIGEGRQKLLEDAPNLDSSLLKEIGPPKSLLLFFLKVLFAVLTFAGAASFLFFTSQLGNSLDSVNDLIGISNISKDLIATNAQVKSNQTNINFYRYLKAKAYLDNFSYYSDSFTHNFEVANSQTASESEIKKSEKIMASDRKILSSTLKLVNQELLQPIRAQLIIDESRTDVRPDTVFEESLRNKFLETSNKLSKLTDGTDNQSYNNYVHAMNLIGNAPLELLLANADFEAMSDSEVYIFLKNVNAVVVNDLSIIQQIKDQRIKWSDIMDEIDLRTMAVDNYYDQDAYDSIGGIRYSSYDFDSSGPRITVTGETRRFDTITFTMIVNLIDELNSSKFFKNGEMRSFSKSGSPEDGYRSSLKISLDLPQNQYALAESPDDEEMNEDSTLLEDLAS